MNAIKNADSELIEEFVSFMSKVKSPFACQLVGKDMLKEKGFSELKESESWLSQISAGGKFFFQRGDGLICGFTIGKDFVPGNAFKIVVGHTDSPCLRIKPISKCGSEGYSQLQVTPYGGGLWRTYFDRDLTICGKIFYKKKGGEMENIYVDLSGEFLFSIPSLAIHLKNTATDFKFNKETEFVPILSSFVNSEENTKEEYKEHSFELLSTLKKKILQMRKDKDLLSLDDLIIEDFDLFVVDDAGAKVGGVYKDLIYSQGLDNRFSCFTGLKGLLHSLDSAQKEEEEEEEDQSCVRMCVLFNHEEVGSNSSEGAQSHILVNLMKRISKILKKVMKTQEEGTRITIPLDYFQMTLSKSFVLSADNAHAVHPNYSSSHHSLFKPKMNQGIVIKQNVNTRYATNITNFIMLKQLMEKYQIPYQKFVIRNDSRCGSTVGPTTNSETEIRTIDVGTSQLSMHSIRETVGALDVSHFTNLFKYFYKYF